MGPFPVGHFRLFAEIYFPAENVFLFIAVRPLSPGMESEAIMETILFSQFPFERRKSVG